MLATLAFMLTPLAACGNREPADGTKGSGGPTTAAENAVASDAVLRVGPNVALLAAPGGKPIVEPHVSAHPEDPRLLLAAAMEVGDPARPFETSRLVSFASRDGGSSWIRHDHDYVGYDPFTVIRKDGSALLTFIGHTGTTMERAPIQVFRSPDAGATWPGAPTSLAGEYDGTKMALDPDTGAVLLTSARFVHDSGGAMTSFVHFNRDAGAGFDRPLDIDQKGAMFGMAQAAALDGGRVIVPAVGRPESEPIEKARAWVHLSADGGATFSAPLPVSSMAGSRKGYIHLVADHSSGRFRDRLYFVRAAGHGDDFQGIWVNRSEDGGRTWSQDTRLDDPASPHGGRPFLPTAAVNRDGVLGISWVVRPGAEGSGATAVVFAMSRDGGETFSPAVRISAVAAEPLAVGNGATGRELPGGGHYAGLAARADGAFQVVWCDSRSGLFQPYTAVVNVGG